MRVGRRKDMRIDFLEPEFRMKARKSGREILRVNLGCQPRLT